MAKDNEGRHRRQVNRYNKSDDFIAGITNVYVNVRGGCMWSSARMGHVVSWDGRVVVVVVRSRTFGDKNEQNKTNNCLGMNYNEKYFYTDPTATHVPGFFYSISPRTRSGQNLQPWRHTDDYIDILTPNKIPLYYYDSASPHIKKKQKTKKHSESWRK